MNEEIEGKELEKNDEEQEAAETTKEVVAGKPTNKGIYVLLFLFVVIFSSAFAYGYKQIITLKNNSIATDAVEERVLAEVDQRIQRSSAEFSDIENQLDELETRQAMLADAVNKPVEEAIHINEDYALAEVEHLLIIATYNLQLDHDVDTALAAMEAADDRLNGLRDPAVLPIREQLIVDMNELRSLNQADLSGLGLFLSDLINRVDKLPLKKNVVVERPDELVETDDDQQTELEGVKQFFVLVWEELKSLVIITRDTEVNKARLLPEEIYFLRANLKLELANARFAVFNRDTDNLQASIGHIQVWLNEYFDLSDASVQNIQDSLIRMIDLELEFPKIDISSSLESVRALIRSQEDANRAINNDEAGLPK
jgi:uncharacterized protein HemX